MRTLVIVPAFNEAKSLPAVAEDLRRHAPDADVCVVDDGSTDGTADVARGLGLGVLRLPLNLGIGGAVQAGYLWAHDHGYDAAVQFDGDGQHDASSMPALLEPIRAGAGDLVVGSRFIGDGAFRSTLARRGGIRYLAGLIRVRCGARVTDSTSGYRAAGRAAIALFARGYPSDYPEPESIAIACRAGLRVVEAPVRMRERAHGASSITLLRSVLYMVKVTVALVLLPVRTRRAGARWRR
jgi:glycosyltransferase involved in cell wall biosynthesis